MPHSSCHVDAGGAPFWIEQRAKRLDALGWSVAQISAAVGVHDSSVRCAIRRKPRYSRCPDCGGMVLMPCLVCAIRCYSADPINMPANGTERIT